MYQEKEKVVSFYSDAPSTVIPRSQFRDVNIGEEKGGQKQGNKVLCFRCCKKVKSK